jgi:NhaP-type Na+/H+ or K+/H+ antiporter
MGEHAAVVVVGLLALGVAAQWIAWRTRIPAIVLLSLAGLLAGPLTPGFFVEPGMMQSDVARVFVSLCVAVILFEGGLSLEASELKVAASGVRRLIYFGAPLAWLSCSVIAHWLGGLGWRDGLYFSDIITYEVQTESMPKVWLGALNRRAGSWVGGGGIG